MINNQLKELDFTPGIRAADINQNFAAVKGWVDRERRRIGGFGLVEGFDISIDKRNFTISVGEGVLVNSDGKEILTKEEVFSAGAPSYKHSTEIITCPASGILELPVRPYNSMSHTYFNYVPPDVGSYPDKNEIYVEDIETSLRVPILRISGKQVYVNAYDWFQKDLRVVYNSANDRIDSIIMNSSGKLSLQKGISSPSPSHVNLGDYKDSFALAVIYWEIGDTLNTEIYTNHRSYRPVYVDEHNVLYLNGEPYEKQKFIYYVLPEQPEEKDIYYDSENNQLLIYRMKDGELGWYPVNDKSTLAIRESKIWTSDDFPDDAQTFLFGEEELNMQFVPGTNALTVVIDNAILMSDQFTEIMKNDSDKSYLNKGIGFKLKDPLDRPTFVECIVQHSVMGAPLTETFQRAAVFVSEGFIYYGLSNTTKTFEVATYYTVGQSQLDVFLNGKRLAKSAEYVEMIDRDTIAGENEKSAVSKYFRILTNLEENDLVSYKISHHVWSYDQLNMVVDEIRDTAKLALSNTAQFRGEISLMQQVVTQQIGALEQKIESMENTIGQAEDFVRKDDKIKESQLATEVKNCMVAGQYSKEFSATETITINDVTQADFILVYYISPKLNKMLERGTDYSISALEKNIRIDLKPAYQMSGSTIYVQVLKIGGR